MNNGTTWRLIEDYPDRHLWAERFLETLDDDIRAMVRTRPTEVIKMRDRGEITEEFFLRVWDARTTWMTKLYV
jgi:hypothetical protein